MSQECCALYLQLYTKYYLRLHHRVFLQAIFPWLLFFQMTPKFSLYRKNVSSYKNLHRLVDGQKTHSFQAQSGSCSAYVKLTMQSSVVYLLSQSGKEKTRDSFQLPWDIFTILRHCIEQYVDILFILIFFLRICLLEILFPTGIL